MKLLSRIFEPTKNRRLNELVGFLLCVSALLLFLAVLSYSPLDPSLNSASVLTGSRAARNWVGIVGAYVSDILLQGFGLGAFLLTVFPGMLGIRWFRSRKVQSPLVQSLGAIWVLMFVPALLAILPGHVRWMNAIPIEGLLGRIVGDALIHYFNLAGAYIVCATVLAVALYLTTAFSFSSVQVWIPTRLAFFFALRDRWMGWKSERHERRMQKELEKRRAQKPVMSSQAVPARGERFVDEQQAARSLAMRQEASTGLGTTANQDLRAQSGSDRALDSSEGSRALSAAEQSRAEAEPLPNIAVT